MDTKPDTLPSHEPAHRYTYLLGAILALVIIDGMVPPSRARLILMEASVFGLAVAGLYAVSGQRRFFHAALYVVVPVVLIQVLSAFVDTMTVALLRYSSLAVLLGLLATVLLRDVLRAERVGRDTVTGSICAYFLFGLLFAMLFSILILIDPGAFQTGETIDHATYRFARTDPLTYLSFVTMSTLGYGDITPQTMQARTLCWFEAVFGQVFLVVLVGRLVGLRIAHSREKT